MNGESFNFDMTIFCTSITYVNRAFVQVDVLDLEIQLATCEESG